MSIKPNYKIWSEQYGGTEREWMLWFNGVYWFIPTQLFVLPGLYYSADWMLIVGMFLGGTAYGHIRSKELTKGE